MAQIEFISYSALKAGVDSLSSGSTVFHHLQGLQGYHKSMLQSVEGEIKDGESTPLKLCGTEMMLLTPAYAPLVRVSPMASLRW